MKPRDLYDKLRNYAMQDPIYDIAQACYDEGLTQAELMAMLNHGNFSQFGDPLKVRLTNAYQDVQHQCRLCPANIPRSKSLRWPS